MIEVLSSDVLLGDYFVVGCTVLLYVINSSNGVSEYGS